jgi:hypothetical protein
MNTSQKPETDTTDDTIDRSMKLVVVVCSLIFSVYFAWFVIFNRVPLSADSAHWGQFGDFVGGILNPLIAFSALFWLTHSVKLQKTELKETRKALEESAGSQTRHASAAEKSMRISGYTAILNAAVVENQTLQEYALMLIDPSKIDTYSNSLKLITGKFANRQEIQNELDALNAKIDRNKNKILNAEKRLRIELVFPE